MAPLATACDAGEMSGSRAKFQAAHPIPRSSIDGWEDEADVLIVGYGGSGACAAIESARASADTLVLERASGGGGTTAMAAGHIYLGGGTRVQRACGYEDSAENLLRYLEASADDPDEGYELLVDFPGEGNAIFGVNTPWLGSTSANTGVSPALRTTCAAAGKLKDGSSTRAPRGSPCRRNASSRARVPEATASTFAPSPVLHGSRRRTLDSNFPTRGPKFVYQRR